MPAPITEAEIASLLSASMSIDRPVQWVQKSQDVWVEATLPIRHPRSDILLTVKITVNIVARSKYSISLLLNNSHRIRGYCHHGSHENKHTDRNNWRHQTHEHLWTDACHGSWARSASDSPDLRSAFFGFCNRLGIDFAGTWYDPPQEFQLELEDQ